MPERRRTISEAQRDRWNRVRRERARLGLPAEAEPVVPLKPHRMKEGAPFIARQNHRWAAECVCGWQSGDHVSDLAAKLAMYGHQEKTGCA